ncbi:twin-arginine translocation pathway signal protein [Novosphingobium sp. BW1]|uniref:twin-arginine translocation pathway signal protein n=1 Tax=Novosphingobium sp. BW1 TaxID=2592621 RepID=UPI0011DEBD22|nr:twin-arginine translocation pathway signal protein [Novosphingobium sp. BW1]TYC81606.1 twin-arginine translocation pathway signal protein [Novosphingobium sp. BW1]
MAGLGRALVGIALVLSTGAASVSTAAVAAEAVAKPSLVPADFAVPKRAVGEGFQIVPLGPELAAIDKAAYMSSIAHLQQTFTRSTAWPHEGITDAEAMTDMETEQARFEGRISFAYAVLTPDGTRERGCVYVQPSPVPGYDAVVRLWVTEAEYEAGFEDELYAFVPGWIEKDWPFARVAYPGRSIDWATWDALTAKN